MPVNQYWSATVYDRATHALIRDMPRAGRSSQSPGLQTKVDGSVDICFGPKPPAGQESNWVPTSAGGRIRGPVPLLRSREAAVRQGMDAVGHRADRRSVSKERSHEKPQRSDLRRLAARGGEHPRARTAQSTPQASIGDTILVTPDNFNRAETDANFAGSEKRKGLAWFMHYREPMSPDFPIVRPNRDTLYSLSVFDLDAGPVTITLPDAGRRFMSMQVIDEDHYTPEVIYGAGTYTFTREDRHALRLARVRILVDPGIRRHQAGSRLPGCHRGRAAGGQRFEVPNWTNEPEEGA